MVLVGDLHGKFEYFKSLIVSKNIHDVNMIQVGDFGGGFNPPDLEEQINTDLNSFLQKRNIILYAIRGNHDNPNFFLGDHFNKWSNLHLLPDYTVLEIEDHKILFVGGAVSVDRKPLIKEQEEERANGNNITLHWETEVFVLDKEKAKSIEGVDIVITHTAPDYCFPDSRFVVNPFVSKYAENDPTLIEDINKERRDMTKLFDILSKKNYIDRHFYGHFHRSNITMNLHTTHYLIDTNELKDVY